MQQSSVPPSLATLDAIGIQLEEYRQLYGLVQYRLTALDQRIPAAGVLLNVLVATIGLLPPAGQIALLIGLPLAAIGLLASALNHARSFGDAVARIAVIEKGVNARAGEELINFQSTHPSRKTIGGRTGRVTIDVVQGAAAALLAGCLYLHATIGPSEYPLMLAYPCGVAAVAATLIYMRSHSRWGILRQRDRSPKGA